MAADNKILGQFYLVGLPSAPRGMPQIEVTFDIDANGIVNVSAKDKATGKEQQIRIQASGGLSDADIEKMVKDAESHASEDKARREMVEARNQADGLIHSTQQQLKEHGEQIDAAYKGAIENAIAELKSAMELENVEEIKTKTQTLAEAAMKMGEAIYKAEQAAGGETGEGASEQAADDGVVDAEFEEVDDEDKKTGTGN